MTLIDGSPEMLRTLSENNRKSGGEIELQNYVLAYIVSLIYQNVDRSKFAYLLEEISWDEKCNRTLNLALELGYQYSPEDLKHTINACYSRALLISSITKDHFGTVKNSKCLFLRPTEVTLEHPNPSYDLSDYFEQPVDVAYVEGNHQTMICSPKMIEILNNIHCN